MEKGLISVDRFTKSSQAYFLTHLHTDHTQGLTSKWGKENRQITLSVKYRWKIPSMIPFVIDMMNSVHSLPTELPREVTDGIFRRLSVETLEGLNTMRPTIGIMPSGLPWVLKPVKGDDNLFGSLLTSRYKKRQPSDKLDEIQEFIELVQPANMKGIVSSSSCYVDPLYYFSRLYGVNQPPKRFVYKN
uniref:DNA repair metallo-beta-lactamase domain-containing protein n=1 Tax=Populus trichocarpa TaxID=3694 RepID=A0A2K1Y4N2_POPTR